MKSTKLSDHDWDVILMALQVAADHWDQAARIGVSYGEEKLWERVCEFRILANYLHQTVRERMPQSACANMDASTGTTKP